jgi:NAD(P)-dependent dehydrogenase (short-subunit alcohol dehydrogenase family)
MANSGAVLITGCSTGIGRATARRLLAGTRPVVATARRPETLAELAASGAEVLALDVTDEESMRAAVGTVVERHGSVGVLVNNAGYSQSGALETLPMDALRRQFETNVFGLVRMCQLALPGMRAQGWGRIVNLSSMGANFTFPGGGAYHATKYAVEAISDALRFEVQGFGVGVTVVQPGLIRTEFATTAAGDVPMDDGPYGRFNAAVAGATIAAYSRGPLARLGGTPEDVAAAIEAAIEARRAPIRVRVTPSARLLIAQKRLLPDALWDRLMATQFPRPRAG